MFGLDPRHLNAETFTKSQKQDYLAMIMSSTKLAALILFPRRFSREFDKGHDAMFEGLDDDTIRYLNIIAPRGIGKTSIIQLAFAARKLLCRLARYLVPIGASLDNEIVQTENLKVEFLTNPIIHKLFGDMRGESFAKTEWETAPLLNEDGSIADHGSFVRPRGKGQQVRGLLYRNSRPDLFMLDDVQTREEGQNPIICDGDMRWLYADVLGAVDNSTGDFRIINLGTNLSEHCMVVRLAEDKSWHTIDMRLCDDNLVSFFPNYMSNEKVKALADTYETAGMFDEFGREFMNINVPTKGAAFETKYFRRYDETDPEFISRLPYMYTGIIGDPARTRTASSADSALLGFSFDRELRRIYVRDIVAEKFTPDDYYAASVEMCLRLGSKMIAYEETGLHEYISGPFTNYIRALGLAILLKPLKARRHTDARIGKNAAKVAHASAMVPFYRMGQVYHNNRVAHLIELPLMAYPKPKRWDVIDCLSYIVEVLEDEQLYMLPSNSLVDPNADNDPYGLTDLKDEDLALSRLLNGPVVSMPARAGLRGLA